MDLHVHDTIELEEVDFSVASPQSCPTKTATKLYPEETFRRAVTIDNGSLQRGESTDPTPSPPCSTPTSGRTYQSHVVKGAASPLKRQVSEGFLRKTSSYFGHNPYTKTTEDTSAVPEGPAPVVPAPPSPRAQCRPSALPKWLVDFAAGLAIWSLSCGLVLLVAWSNYLVGYAHKWTMSFVLNFAGVPLVFGVLARLGVPHLPPWISRAQLYLFALSSALVAMAYGFPLALTGNRLVTAVHLSAQEGRTHAYANCWAHPEPANGPANWNDEVEYIHWADSDWYIDREAAVAVQGSNYISYTVAPIQLRATSPLYAHCGGYRAYAVCFCDRDTPSLCNPAELERNCAWDLRPGLSRVIRKQGFYAPYQFGSELKNYQKAVAASGTPAWPLRAAGSYKPLVVWWATDLSPDFYAEKAGALRHVLKIQTACFAAFWPAVAAVWLALLRFLS